MTELVVFVGLLLIIFALLSYQAFINSQHQAERSKLLNAIMARTAEQFRDLELTSKVQPIEPPRPPQIVPEADMTEQEFDDMIKESVA